MCSKMPMVVVYMSDGSHGLLEYSVGRAFDGSEDWWKLDVISENGRISFNAAQIELPPSLRQYIAYQSLQEHAGNLQSSLIETMSQNDPCFNAHVEFEGLQGKDINASYLHGLPGIISDLEQDGYVEKSETEGLKRVIAACLDLMTAGQQAALSRACSGH